VLLGSAGLATAPVAAASPATYYLSLGDSVAASAQPTGNTQGYSEALHKALRRRDDKDLKLVKLGCGGETVASMIDTAVAGFCTYPAGAPDTQNQLDVALDFIADHPGQIALVTITIGANDALACLDFATFLFDQGCLDQSFPAAMADLATVLTALQAAAPGVPIVGSTYPNVFLGLWVFGPDARTVALANAPIVADLNAQIEAAYTAAGVPVADVTTAFDADNFTDTVTTKKWGEIPVNVARICTWTWFCDDTYTFDVHARTRGYRVIADAFLDALP
jgi:lysophospholipase L1-like esterase